MPGAAANEDERLELLVRGRVQGVGFRAYVLRNARRLRLRGRVRNLPDGSVEVVAEGPAGDLRRLELAVRVGPRGARVEAAEMWWTASTGEFRAFEIAG